MCLMKHFEWIKESFFLYSNRKLGCKTTFWLYYPENEKVGYTAAMDIHFRILRKFLSFSNFKAELSSTSDVLNVDDAGKENKDENSLLEIHKKGINQLVHMAKQSTEMIKACTVSQEWRGGNIVGTERTETYSSTPVDFSSQKLVNAMYIYMQELGMYSVKSRKEPTDRTGRFSKSLWKSQKEKSSN